jgi:hypothetical protein
MPHKSSKQNSNAKSSYALYTIARLHVAVSSLSAAPQLASTLLCRESVYKIVVEQVKRILHRAIDRVELRIKTLCVAPKSVAFAVRCALSLMLSASMVKIGGEMDVLWVVLSGVCQH